MYWILLIGIMLLSWIVQATLRSKFSKYSKIPVSSGLTGAEVARRMLQENGITNVQVTSHAAGLPTITIL